MNRAAEPTPRRPEHLRDARLDALRVLGVAAVVVAHVYGGALSHEWLYTWVVPLFFVLSGYLHSPGRSLRAELSVRATTLAVPYLSWLLVLLAMMELDQRLHGRSLRPQDLSGPLLGGVYAQRPFSAFWFFSALLAAALVLRVGDRVTWLSPTLGTCGLLLALLQPRATAAVPLALGVALVGVAFSALGQWLHRLRHALPGAGGRAGLLGLALLAGSAGLVAAVGPRAAMDLKHADLGVPVVSVLLAAAITCGLVLLASAAPPPGRRLGGWITRLARSSTFVVLAHAGVLWLRNTPPTGGLLDLLLALVLTWGLGLVTLHVRWLAPLHGSWVPPTLRRTRPEPAAGAWPTQQPEPAPAVIRP